MRRLVKDYAAIRRHKQANAAAGRRIYAKFRRDEVVMDVERDGVEVAVRVNVDGGEAHRAFTAYGMNPGEEVVLTRAEERQAVDLWMRREENREARHDTYAEARGER